MRLVDVFIYLYLYLGMFTFAKYITNTSKWKLYILGYAFHVDVATAYKIIRDTFSELEVCELTELQLFPPQHMVSMVQKGSPLRKMMAYG